MNTGLFDSFFLGGFECSTHRLHRGTRLDLIASTRHDHFAPLDYRLLQHHGIRTARDGLRWHLIETAPGKYDFSSATGMLNAARGTRMQVIWDLWHYGWPDDIDLFSGEFVSRFVKYARECAKLLSEHFEKPYISPINEISFFSWAAGDGGIFNPFQKNRGGEVKRQLVRATIESIAAMREVNDSIRFFQIDPMINVVAKTLDPNEVATAEEFRLGQYESWDMICGRTQPELGGSEDMLDVVGVNYYIHNQWVLGGSMIVPSDPRYRHVSNMLTEVYKRYDRPLFVAETGIEDDTRPAWFRYMCNEVFSAMTTGTPIEGICLYPILNHPGWEDERHCYNGMFDYADAEGERAVFEPLAVELSRQQTNYQRLKVGQRVEELEIPDTSALDWAAHVMQERTDESRAAETA